MGASESAQPWDWPTGCLDGQRSRIEVHVRDDETGRSTWVPGVPKARITDQQGRNTHLCAEYRWNGELYIEDFGPERVRLSGEVTPVSDMLAAAAAAAEAAAAAAGEGAEAPAPEEGSDWSSWLLGATSCAGRRGRQGAAPPGAAPTSAPAAKATSHADTLACAVCMDAPGDAVLVPCLHGGICSGCAKQIAENRAVGGARCPQCRTAIQGFVHSERPRQQQPSRPGGQQPKPRAPPPRHRGSRPWRWPAWCLSQRPALIEVYVGEVLGDHGRWVPAEPRSRIVDAEGHDRYLCAEYDWDGERYVEDFQPDRVRRRGQVLAVSELLLLD